MKRVNVMLAMLLATVSIWLPTNVYADYASTCAGCHGGYAVNMLPNGTGTSGSIRAANNRSYLDTKIAAGAMTSLSGLAAANRDSIVAEISAGSGVAPVITSIVPPNGEVGTPYSFTVTASGGSESCSATLPATSCIMVLNATGARTLTATYSGDANFIPDTDTEAHGVVVAGTIFADGFE